MLNEVVELLNIKAGASIIDATLNGGGHTEEILEKYPDVKVLGIEWDPDIVENLKLKIKNGKSDNFRERLIIINDSYVDLRAVVEKYNFQPDGIIFDLGLSSWHYEKSGRGFSFMRDEPLDMRFNPNETVKTAADILNTAPEVELEEIIRLYGEEDFAEDIAKRIVTARKSKPIVGTQDLVAVIMDSVPGWYKKRKIHPATKTFQALRDWKIK